MADSKFRDREFQKRAIPWAGIVLVFLMVISPMLPLFDEQNQKSNDVLKDNPVNIQREWSQETPSSIGDFERGGRHLVTNEWWEPTLPYIPTVDDPDGDGVNSSEDVAPWNPNLPVQNALDCTTELCQRKDVFSLSRTGEFAPFTEEDVNYSMVKDSALGDLDHDGDLDMVLLHKDAIEISVNLDGAFQKPGNCTIWGEDCQRLNHDGITYSSHWDLGIGAKIELADMDSDGDLDIVAAGSKGIGIILMNGSEILGHGLVEHSSWQSPSRANWENFDIGDVNGDGRPDIAVASLWQTSNADAYRLRVSINNCSGDLFSGGWDWNRSWKATSGKSYGLEFVDVNNDGYDDLIASTIDADNTSRFEIVVYPSDGTKLADYPSNEWSFSMEGFTYTSGTLTWSSTTSQIYGIDSADLNGDGFIDLIVSGYLLGFALFNDGSGTINSFPQNLSAESHIEIICTWADGPCGAELPHRATADINNDGLVDILYGHSIYLNSGSNNDGESNQFEPFWGAEASVLKVGDLTGNGVLDVIGVAEEGGPIVIFTQGGSILSNEIGNSQMPMSYNLESMSSNGLVSDYDFDGDLDIFAATNNYLLLLVNDGVGTFTKTVITAQSSISSIGIGDIDGDGVSDLVVASYNRVFVYWGYSVSNGAVAFEQNSSTVFDYSTWTWYYGNTVPDSLIIEDFDGDGKDEISFDVYYGWSMFKYSRIYEYNNTALNYTQSPRSNFSFDMVWYSTTATGTLQANKLMDMNNDGNDDFVRCHSNSIQIYNSSGDYFSVAPWNLSVSGKNCMLFDATLDGTPDLLSINGSTIEVRMGPDYNYLVMTKVIYAITEFKIYDMDQDGLLELLIATSENKRMRIHDLDTTGIIGQIWEGGSYSNTRSVTIGDFNNDGRPDVLQQNSGSAWDLIYGIQDTDYDTLGDTDDVFPMDPTQKTDSDGDGYGDSKIGMMGDNCTYYWGDSQYDQRGCPDQDGDGWSDLGDDFWREPTQWKDTDGDGFGDNHDGSSSRLIHWPGEFIENAYNPDPSPLDFDNDGFEDEELSMVGIDDCPKEAGWSFEDRFGCLDTDGDGWSNNDQQGFWTKGDKFPNDFTQHNDTDGDGFGDNIDGTQGDSCPTVSGKSFRDRFGCPDNDKDGWSEDSDFDDNDPSKWGIDSDGDGISDDNDHFPNDPQQSRDSDNDGYGDSAGDYGDACPGQEGYSYIDKYGCSDTDDDGVSDQGDKCPTIPGWSSEPWLGCPDSDDDGIADIIDAFPDNSNETRDKDQDGIGDNADICTHSLDNLTIDCSEDYDNDGFADLEDKFPADAAEWIDSDGDGVGDNGDVWPLDGDIWSDADGDLWADQFGHILTDDCPSLNGTSSIFMNGCSDLDEDGMPDILDPDIDGDGITNDNEMDASTKTVTYDPFDADSKPSDIDGDLIPDVLDHDRDGDGFPDELERERGSDYKDANKTPFNKYGNQDTGLFYVPGEGFKSQYDPEGVEISVSWLIDLITSELLVPLAMIPLTVFALMRKRRRYKKMRNRLEDCKDLDMLKEYEEDIDDMVINRKVKVEHGMLLRNMFERMKEQFEDQEQVRLLGGKSSAGSGGMGRGGNMQQSGPMIPERLRKQGMGGPGGSPGPRRPGGRY